MSIIYVMSRNMKNFRFFLSENFNFLVVKFSVCLNRHVVVMGTSEDTHYELIQLLSDTYGPLVVTLCQCIYFISPGHFL